MASTSISPDPKAPSTGSTQDDFPGVIGPDFRTSVPWWPPMENDARGKPDVVVVVLDDVGFAGLGCYGAEIDTPTIDALAEGGVRFNDFNVTPLCSPTRACLLTGRNHHSVGMAYLSNVDSGFPGYRGRVTESAATMAEVLQDAGYGTLAIGKWHLAPLEDTTAVGPYDQWPLGRGFGRYYGFLDALTDHFYPDVVEDNHRVDPPGTPEDGYHLTEDLIDHAIGYVRDQVSVKPEQPFFLYLAFGTAHCPHQAPQEYLDKYRGRYDEGWDVIRARRFQRQKELGIIPPDATLAPLNPGVEEWADLTPDQQRLFARFQEAYAAMLDHTDAELGRLVDFLDSIGRLDNTIIVVLSDNGASQEGGPDGGADIVTYEEDRFCTVEFNLERFDTIGGPHSQTNIPWGWAQAANTPLRWYKQNTYAGGVRTPMVISWPQGIGDTGAVRAQFVHAIDIAPTLFDLAGVTPKQSYNGVDQMPYHGASIRGVLDDAGSSHPRDRQYFEMIGHRAMWQDGWKALARHRRNEPFEDDPWELYHIDSDFSECRDVATEHPDRLADLVRQWSEEAGRYSVFPLDDRYLAVRASTFQTPGSPRARDTFTYLGGATRIPGGVTPIVFNRSFSITARVGPLDESAQGVLVAVGDTSGGYVLYLSDGRLVFEYCYLGDRQTVASPPGSISPGSTELAFRFERTGDYRGTGRLESDGVVLCEQSMSDMARGMISWGSLSVGADTLSPVSNSYEGEFPFSGNIAQVEFNLSSREQV
ncbi:MAG: arylsulfatase [bacterium]|nr:arylsulfatase [Acidimicrobiia bacterium]MCY4651076.1 arylsulfatase [bacterium]